MKKEEDARVLDVSVPWDFHTGHHLFWCLDALLESLLPQLQRAAFLTNSTPHTINSAKLLSPVTATPDVRAHSLHQFIPILLGSGPQTPSLRNLSQSLMRQPLACRSEPYPGVAVQETARSDGVQECLVCCNNVVQVLGLLHSVP